ncbi:MAG: RnfABCDGE type electron transport complex subunit A [Defluviitaleaceae bacterium]|nr:RnfABCDGE type electron transport complex subunit A [Defluviitaleaceae bacterium]
MELFSIFIGASLVSNIILANFLGICSFMGVSKKSSSALGMGFAVVFVITTSSMATWAIFHFLLVPFQLEFMRTIVFILVIATLVQFVEMYMKKNMQTLYKALGVYLPLITVNCAVLGAALLNIDRGFNFLGTVSSALGISLGYTLVIFIFSTIRERLELANTPRGFRGAPIALITAAIMAMAFFGFFGLGG